MIEFSIDRADLIQALKPFFGGRPRGKSAALDYVDIKAEETEAEFITTGFSSSSKAEVTSSGCARLPFPLFETLFRNPQKLAWSSAGRLTIRIKEGQIQAGPFTLDHRDVSIPAFNERIADLPSNASLADTLALNFRFTVKELGDSGLWDRAQAARQRTGELIDRASRILEPLEITRDDLLDFVYGQVMKKKAPPSKLSSEMLADSQRFVNRMSQAQQLRQEKVRSESQE
jgi:hypothetical protein